MLNMRDQSKSRKRVIWLAHLVWFLIKLVVLLEFHTEISVLGPFYRHLVIKYRFEV